MRLKVGDRVKFLNDHGGGVVSKVISSNLVHVKDSDGFEIPTLTNELVKVEEGGQSGRMFSDDFVIDFREKDSKKQGIVEDEGGIVYDDRSSKLSVFAAKGNDKKGIYLAFVPQDQKWLLTGNIDVFLVNFSDFDILFSVFLRKPNGAWEGADYDAVKPNHKILLNSISREEIERWSYGLVQILFHKDLSSKVLAPANCTFSFKPTKLYQENVYLGCSFLNEKSFMLSLAETEVQQTIADSPLGEKYDEEIKEQFAKPKKPEELINQHKTSPQEAVVDLHIGDLLDEYSKMSNAEMLNYQLNYFVKCLESAIRSYVTKVIFIHGVGDGILKGKIHEILNAYQNVKYKDASMKNFGYGATEVLIWHGAAV